VDIIVKEEVRNVQGDRSTRKALASS